MGLGSIVSGVAGAVGSIIGGSMNNNASAAAAQQNYEAQKEFAQNGIRWKVADAKAAGLHPLAALGASSANFTPSFQAGDYSYFGDAGQNLGQSLGRAIDAKASRYERAKMEAHQDQMNALAMKRAQLENRFLETQIVDMQLQASQRAVKNQQQVPPMPLRADGAIIDGQGNATASRRFEVKPAEIVANAPGRPGTEAGSITDLGFARTNDGGYAPVMSNDAKQRYEEDLIGEIGWNLRNRLPVLIDDQSIAPPKEWLPDGYDSFVFNSARGAWYPRKAGHKRLPFLDLDRLYPGLDRKFNR
uniref:DNA pilot protein n=1 Tax=Dulem virus 85 TaxID=3145796 RepID=A0AAU8B951_9VIRU